jgi:hypothetical protein
VVQLDLLIDEFLVLGSLPTIQLKVEIETRHRLTDRLVIRNVQLLHVGMCQSLLNGDTLCGVKGEHFLNQINSVRV